MTLLRLMLCGCGFAASFALPAEAGSISGRVEAQPPDSSDTTGAGGNYGSRRFKFLKRLDYSSLTDFVVYIERVSQPASESNPPKVSISQKDGEFEPRVLAVVAGTEVEFTNMDDIFHNVFSMSETCEFDLGLYKKGDGSRKVRFGLPGKVEVFCSIHTQMSCVVLVVPNPWFAKTDSTGRYSITGVPAGTYRLRAWHERVPGQTLQIVVPENGDVKADFVLGTGQRPRS